MKIFIIGPAGSGKSTLAQNISHKYNIKQTNLDDLFWDNSINSYGIKRNNEERMELLQNVLDKNSWIIEGVYVEWPKKAFNEADEIVYLDISMKKIKYRIWKRFIKRKIGIEKTNKKETIKSLTDLLKWNIGQAKEISELIKSFKNNNFKVIHIRNNKDISVYLTSKKNF